MVVALLYEMLKEGEWWWHFLRDAKEGEWWHCLMRCWKNRSSGGGKFFIEMLKGQAQTSEPKNQVTAALTTGCLPAGALLPNSLPQPQQMLCCCVRHGRRQGSGYS